jgi:cytochrome c oxidase cbb3-type subunit 4
MLKFIKGHMSSIGGIEVYPIISFLIFFLFFVGVTWWVLRQDKKLIQELGNIPLNDQANETEKLNQ